MALVEDGEGGWEMVRTEDRPTKTIGFKVTEEAYAALIPFFEAFHTQTVSEAMRWLIDNEGVKAIMLNRIRSQTKLRRQPQNGQT